jgi:hypothetical protein
LIQITGKKFVEATQTFRHVLIAGASDQVGAVETELPTPIADKLSDG